VVEGGVWAVVVIVVGEVREEGGAVGGGVVTFDLSHFRGRPLRIFGVRKAFTAQE